MCLRLEDQPEYSCILLSGPAMATGAIVFLVNVGIVLSCGELNQNLLALFLTPSIAVVNRSFVLNFNATRTVFNWLRSVRLATISVRNIRRDYAFKDVSQLEEKECIGVLLALYSRSGERFTRTCEELETTGYRHPLFATIFDTVNVTMDECGVEMTRT